jgi:carbonic anhydrase|tara:strand:- start:2202 stop:3125 length:924 start_codon:yes stop_codon:yes gene_type:complete
MASIKSAGIQLISGTNTIDCSNATSPVNISTHTSAGPCSLKCDYNHNYGIYTPNISNNENYLSLNYSGKTNPVQYNDENYTVTEVRIYQPSLHSYNSNTHADGEILIIHNGPGKNLIVSVPFISGGKNDKGSAQLGKLLEEASTRTPTKNDAATISVGNFSLDNFIPDRKGFYSYTGTLPYKPCNGTYSYIVYNIDDALNIKSSVLDKLKKILKTVKVDVKNNSVFYNEKGANSNNNDDTIYIDCQPVNSSGELLVQEGAISKDGYSADSADLAQLESVGYIILVGIIAYGVIWGSNYLLKKFNRNT